MIKTKLNSTRVEFYLKMVLIGFISVLVISIGILGWVPPVSRDALTHHLAVPKLYLQHGGVYEIPSVEFSYYPMNLDFLYLIPLYFGNDIAPKFIHFLFAMLTAGILYGYLKKRSGTLWGLCGAALYLSLPIVVKLSITVYVDLGLVFFSTAALIYLFKWIENRFQVIGLILSGIFCGLALGTKYNGMIVLFLLTAFVPFIYISQSKKTLAGVQHPGKRSSTHMQLKALGYGALFCLMALLVFSPWMVRNYIWQSNPVYPLYNSRFNPTPVANTVEANQSSEENANAGQIKKKEKLAIGSGNFAFRKAAYNETWWQIMLLPLRIFFQGQDDNPKYFDGKLNPFLLFLPLFAFWPSSKHEPEAMRVEKPVLAAFAILFILYAFSQTAIRIRYIAPAIPPLVILSVIGLKRIVDMGAGRQNQRSARLAAAAGIAAAVVMFGANTVYIYKQFHYVQPFEYISGQISRDDYITRYRSEYPVIQYANRNLQSEAKILALYLGKRLYYSDREMVADNSLFEKLVGPSDSADMLADKLNQMDFSHVLVRFDLFNHWTSSRIKDRKKQRMIMDLFNHRAKLLIASGGYGLFQLNAN
jgi:4-amino-4-deoxy-L-arabinose transferase-like glycosyltransferase